MHVNTLAAWLALLIYLAFAYAPWRAALTRLSQRLGDWSVGLLLLPYLLAVSLRPPPGDLLRLALYLALPTLCLRRARPLDRFHVLAILAIWVPIEPDLFLLALNLVMPIIDLPLNLSLLPEVEATLVSDVALPIHTLTAISLALFVFLVRHPLKGIGFTFRLRRQDLQRALAGLSAFTLIGLPLGLGMGFLQVDPTAPELQDIIVGIVGGYLLVALMEEVLFRGVIQNLLSRRLGNDKLSLPIAAIVFGLAHLNNATEGFATPNWAYALMATLAGLAYGWVWMRTGRVTASAITHALVNLIWVVLFP